MGRGVYGKPYYRGDFDACPNFASWGVRRCRAPSHSRVFRSMLAPALGWFDGSLRSKPNQSPPVCDRRRRRRGKRPHDHAVDKPRPQPIGWQLPRGVEAAAAGGDAPNVNGAGQGPPRGGSFACMGEPRDMIWPSSRFCAEAPARFQRARTARRASSIRRANRSSGPGSATDERREHHCRGHSALPERAVGTTTSTCKQQRRPCNGNVLYLHRLRLRSSAPARHAHQKERPRLRPAAGGLNSAFGRRSFSLLLMRIISTSRTKPLSEAHRFSDFRANLARLAASSWDTCNSTLQRAPG